MLCKDSWIELTWDGLARRRSKENVKVEFKKQASNLIPFNKACDLVAEEIYDICKDLYLGLSGGSDSEHVANVLYRNKIPFTPLIIEYNHIQSDSIQETWWAKQWCKQHQIEPLIVYSNDYTASSIEKERFLKVRPRMLGGIVTTGIAMDAVETRGGKLLTGYQLEYYPDSDQMTYLEPQLGNYIGFVLEETDLYLETLSPNQHPWAFYYWSPEILSAFVNEWNTEITMQENKAAIYNTSLRPKILYDKQFFDYAKARGQTVDSFGTLDCALLGTKDTLLKKLVK